MNSDYEAPMTKLIKHFLRKFYPPRHFILMDTLLEHYLLNEISLCEKLKILPRELFKIAAQLREDRLLKQETRIENKEDFNQIMHQVFFLNFSEIRDVIKYKVLKMTRILEHEMNKKEEMFVCSTCKKEFSVLDAQSLQRNFLFRCDECDGMLEESRKVLENDPHNLYGLLMDTVSDLVSLMKNVDKFDIPSIDYFQALEMKKMREKQKGVEMVKDDVVDESPSQKDSPVEIRQNYDDDIDFAVGADRPKSRTTGEISSHENIYVSVGGVDKPLDEIKDEDIERMNGSEYEKYYELLSRYNEV